MKETEQGDEGEMKGGRGRERAKEREKGGPFLAAPFSLLWARKIGVQGGQEEDRFPRIASGDRERKALGLRFMYIVV